MTPWLAACGDSADDTTGATPDAGGHEAHTNDVTWHGEIAPIVSRSCGGCHQDGGIAPFSMATYDQAAPWAGLMADAVESGRMPPFLARDTESCVPRYSWRDDPSLNDAEKQLLRRWVDAGAPEGDAKHAASLPTPPSLGLESPDLTLTIPTPVTLEGNKDRFECFVLETGLAQDTWFDAIQINAGNDAIVHHVLVYDDQAGNLDQERIDAQHYECFGGVGVAGATLVAAWAPGAVANLAPPGVATQLLADTRLVMQVHYHPTGGAAETDSETSVDIRFFDGEPEYIGGVSLLGNFAGPRTYGGLMPGPNDRDGVIEFRIPAGEAHHMETQTFTIPPTFGDWKLYGMATHMHYVGVNMEIHLERTNTVGDEPEQECLIQTPSWDFNWQRGYYYDVPLDQVPISRPGDKFHLRCQYDNSMGNPFVRDALQEQGLDAPRDVFIGEETLDEMCLGAFIWAQKREPATTL